MYNLNGGNPMGLTIGNSISLEMIGFNVKSDFYKEMILEVGKLRTNLKDYGKELGRGKEVLYAPISATIEKYTGISVSSYLVPNSYGISPAVIPPDLDRNNPLLHPLKTEVFKNDQLNKQLKKNKTGILEGTVNFETGRVGGDFSKVTSTLIIPNMILSTKTFTDEEIAAMLLHEVGHIFSYFMYLNKVVTVSHVLDQLTNKLNEIEVESEKINLIKETNELLNVDTLEAEDLIKIKDGERISTVIVSEVAKERLSYTDTPVFDFRTWEAISDQYASRNGASVALATGLDKIYRLFNHAAYWSTGKYVLISIFSLPMLVIGFPLMLFFSLLVEPYDPYDKPIDRIKRIRRELVGALKKRNLDKKQSKRIQNELKTLDDILSRMSDRKDMFEVIWRLINVKLNKDRKQTAYLNELEIMANNELYVRANRLKHS